MLARASAETGLADFGGDEFLEALNQLVESTNRDTRLTSTGATAAREEIHRILVNRARFADDLKRHPEILREDLSGAFIILGLPRTGTTKLQRMMSADPDVIRLEFWKTLNFAPFPETTQGEEDPRIEAARQAVIVMDQLMPDWRAIHGTDAEAADEEVFLQAHTCKSILQYLARPVTSYQTWYKTQSQRDTYAYMKRQLQYLQWQDGGRRGRPWILKSPAHVGVTDLLLEFFPDATLVFTHRDVYTAVASFCRLIECHWQLYLDSVDKEAVGQTVCEVFLTDLDRHIQLRDELGDALALVDVPYANIKSDCLGVIREIYARAGRELTPERERAMTQWEASHPQHAAGKVAYCLEDYGLARDEIATLCGDYLERFAGYLQQPPS